MNTIQADSATPTARSPFISQQIAVCIVFVSAMFMNIMDITIVNVALPSMGIDLDAPGTGISAVSISYVVSIAVVIPLSGWLGDRFGHRRVLLTAIVIFTVASALCGLSQNLAEIVVFRILQGIGSGLMTPVGMALLYRTFPPSERVRVASILVIPTVLAPALGPVVGGFLVDGLSWRWVFYVNVPIGTLALLFGLIFLRGEPGEPVGPFDFFGFALAGIGLASLMFGVSEGPRDGWSSPTILATLIGGFALLVLLVFTQLRTEHPLLALRLFRDRLFRSANAVTMLGAAAFFGFLFVLALFLQNGLGFSPIESGLSTMPEAIGVLVGSQLVSRLLYPRFGPKPIMIVGLLGEATFLLLLTTIHSESQAWIMRVMVFFVGYFMSHMSISSQVATMARIDRADTSAASTLFNAGRQVASASGVAILATTLALVGEPIARRGHVAGDLSSYHIAFAVAAGMAVTGALIALTIRNSDADATRQRKPAQPEPATETSV
ncbi:MAG: family efflux transporter permease subunit [Pseudonocardiales bacterium]|nr:family efflux transporter permease subunit [Pseudonocardiales bacterium]